MRETLLALSDRDRFFTYDIIGNPMPVRNFVATFSVKPVTEGNKSFVEWTADFDVAEADEERMKTQVGQAFAGGIAHLAKQLGAPL